MLKFRFIILPFWLKFKAFIKEKQAKAKNYKNKKRRQNPPSSPMCQLLQLSMNFLIITTAIIAMNTQKPRIAALRIEIALASFPAFFSFL